MIGIATAVDVADLKETTLLNMGIFGLFVAVTMVIVIRASRNNKTAADYYAAVTFPQFLEPLCRLDLFEVHGRRCVRGPGIVTHHSSSLSFCLVHIGGRPSTVPPL